MGKLNFAQRRSTFKRALNKRLKKDGLEIIFLRYVKDNSDPKFEGAWVVVVEFDGQRYTKRAKIYKDEKPLSVRVLKDFASDLILWKEVMADD